MSTWFDKLSSQAQADYCAGLKGGKKKSKFCNIETGTPLPASERPAPKPRKPRATPAPASNGQESSSAGRDHNYYDANGDHVWAKKSEIKNLGEDISGSARHKKNAGRDWGDLTSMSENKDFTKKELLKIDSITPDNVPEGHEIPFWVIKDILSKYPDEKGLKPEDKKLWIEKYQYYLAEGKKIATENRDPIITADLFTAFLDADGKNLGRGTMAERAVRYFSRNSRRDAFFKASGPISKLQSVVPMEKFRGIYKTEERYKIMMDHLDEINAAEKIKDVIAGKPFLSTITGQKAQVDRFDEGSVYKDIIMGRLGDNVFDDADESGGYLKDSIGFKGIQFGNSLPDSERAEHLGHASHAFHDMCEALGINPTSVSMNGKVSIGFGSRGVAGSLATYHPGHKFININRKNGYGALAHEWGHAYGFNISENILAKKGINTAQRCCFSELKDNIVSGTPYAETHTKLRSVEKKVRDRLWNSDEFKRMGKAQKKWLWSSAEMFARAFETYTAKKMEQKGKTNTYLVSKITAFGWPTDEEMKDYDVIFDELLKTEESFK